MNDPFHAFFRAEVSEEPTREGELGGRAFAVKEAFEVRGWVAAAGNPDWLRTHEAAAEHAWAIQRLLENGARLRGTTHTDELMFSLNGENEQYGTPVNPRAPDRIPGGSSSGSAVAVSSGAVDFALGTDTGGSVRIPSCYCGVFGFRPTHGHIPVTGVVPLAPSFDTVGWMARDPEVLLRVGRVLLGASGESGAAGADHPTGAGERGGATGSPHLAGSEGTAGFRRVLVAEDALKLSDPEGQTLVEEAARKMAPLGFEVERGKVSSSGLEGWAEVFRNLQGLEVKRTHREWIERVKPRFGDDVAGRFAWALGLDESGLERNLRLREEIRGELLGRLEDDLLLLIPTAPGEPPLRGLSGEALAERRTRILRLTCIAGLGGLPQVTIPAVMPGGMPFGISLVAGPGQDARLLAEAAGRLGSLSTLRDLR